MQEFSVSRLQKTDIQELGALISSFDFNDYKYYKVFKKEVVCDYILRQISNLLLNDKQNWIIVARHKDKIAGLVSLIKLDWAEEVFDFEAAEIKHIIVSGEYGNKKDVTRDLLAFVSQICNQERISHLSCRISTDDYSVIYSLEEQGFKIADTLVTFLFNKRKHKILKLKNMAEVRSFKEEDLKSLIDMVKGAFPLSRFCADQSVSAEHIDRFYIKWLKGCCQGSLADKVLVAERKGEVVGFLSYKINKELEKLTGYKVGYNGLSSVSKRGIGIYPAMIRASTMEVFDFGEYDTQINNYEVIKIWQRFGFDFIRSRYSFYKRISK